MDSAHQAPLSFTISQSLLKFTSIELVMLSNDLTFCHPLLLLPSIFPSIRVFSSELALPIRWPKYWSFSFSISPSYEYLHLASCRIDWFDLLGVQESSPTPQFKSISSSSLSLLQRFPDSSVGKESTCNAGDTSVRFLGWEDPLEKGKATHASILAWRIPWTA
ncbi:unnamed protein product [Rangifer tarandus platyrhynchus]|uniref:Uncharacterized protein n=1 Tax=Rangifer tarandus platyrhynchus TaxID=3082113 RepID=A0ABN8XXZ2_RANTA|nr:unnamed protein product [Rangifer tarandus platyrhynchus]